MPNPSVVQTNTAKSTAASNLAVSLASLPAVGRWVVVTVWSHTFGTVFNPTCADNQGNTYARDAFKQDGSNNGLVAIFSALVNASSGTFTVTVSNATASDLVEVSVSEVANLVAASVVDGSSSAAGTSTSPAPGPVTTANAPDIVFAVSQNADTSSSATYTTPVGFVSIQRDTSGSLDWCGEAAYQVEASAGTYNPTWTTGSFAWSAVQVAYKGVSGSGTQAGYRWRADDGDEAAASWLAAEEADITAPTASNVRLRLLIDSAGDLPASAYQVEYKKSTDSNYAQVPAAQPTAQIPTFVAKGTFTSGAAALTVPQPAGIQAGDLLLLFVETANQAMATPTGWTQVTNSPQSTGTAAAAGGVRLTVFYKIAGASETSVSLGRLR
jgi:hypothetical protein